MLRTTGSRDSTCRPFAIRPTLTRPLSTVTQRHAHPATQVELRWALRALCLTEIVSWGVLYYAFPVLTDTITRRQGWSTPVLSAAFSMSLLISAAVGIPAGRLIQRHGPRWVMTGGSLIAVAAVLLIASAPNLPLFYVGWAVAGVAMAGVLYAPAFAAITVWFGADRVKALTAVTLVAGLASTVFAPLTAAINDHLGWRGTYTALAVVLAVLTVPTHYLALRLPWPDLPHRPAYTGEGIRDGSTVSRSTLALLATAFTFSTLGVYAAVVNLVPLLAERGIGAGTAAVVLGVGGIGQVAGRLGYARLARVVTLRTRTAAVLAACAATIALLGLTPGPLWLLVVASALAGNARGIFTLVQATAISDRWGASQYARLNGVFGAPIMAASAVAPFVGSGLANAFGSYPAAFAVLAVIGLAASALTLLTSHGPRRTEAVEHVVDLGDHRRP